jgi:hypothetical protein
MATYVLKMEVVGYAEMIINSYQTHLKIQRSVGTLNFNYSRTLLRSLSRDQMIRDSLSGKTY